MAGREDITHSAGGLALATRTDLPLVHRDEVLVTRDTSDPLRVTAQGLEWPETRRQSEPCS
jgi:hypothetical protein